MTKINFTDIFVQGKPVYLRPVIPVNSTVVLGNRMILVHGENELRELQGRLPIGWSKYTLGEREIQRERRRHPPKRPHHFIYNIDEDALTLPPDENETILFEWEMNVKLGYDMQRQLHKWLKETLLGDLMYENVIVRRPPYKPVSDPHP